MKKTMLILIVCAISTFTYAQKDKYVSMMEKTITQMDAAKNLEDLQKAANIFERVANAEKEEWLPLYYTALCNVNLASRAMRNGEKDKVEAFVNKAQAALDQSKELAPNESEIFALQGYIYISRIWSGPMTAGAKFSPMAHQAFGKAIALNDKNPRAYYLRGQLVYNTPEFFGGGPKNAHQDLLTADSLFKSYEKESSIHPDWGMGGNTYHLKEAEKAMEKEKVAESEKENEQG